MPSDDFEKSHEEFLLGQAKRVEETRQATENLFAQRSREQEAIEGSIKTGKIIEIIKRRREMLRDLASIGNASDALVASAAQVAREKAEEYDSLLTEIENSK